VKDGYHYYPSLDRVNGWLIDAGFAIDDEAVGDGYHHVVARAQAPGSPATLSVRSRAQRNPIAWLPTSTDASDAYVADWSSPLFGGAERCSLLNSGTEGRWWRLGHLTYGRPSTVGLGWRPYVADRHGAATMSRQVPAWSMGDN
jgi:hypothetical protein